MDTLCASLATRTRRTRNTLRTRRSLRTRAVLGRLELPHLQIELTSLVLECLDGRPVDVNVLLQARHVLEGYSLLPARLKCELRLQTIHDLPNVAKILLQLVHSDTLPADLVLQPPKGVGFVVRTAGTERTKSEMARDMAYLLRLWKSIVRRMRKYSAPIDIYQESDMIIRTIRDMFTEDVGRILIDEPAAYERAREFLELVMPKYVERLQLYEGKEPLFHRYGLEEEIGKMYQRKVPLKGGGSIVIDQTEALVAIDVNSGSFRTEKSAEENAYQMNLIAAKEIARQLRLRDLGGVIVNDFIDMRREKYRRGVEKALHDAMKRDRARTKILRTSPFGLIEMTRQRIRPSLRKSIFRDCPTCTGTGMVKTAESMAIEVMRTLQLSATRGDVTRLNITVHDEVATWINNRKRREITQFEDATHIQLHVDGKDGVSPEHFVLEAWDTTGRAIRFP